MITSTSRSKWFNREHDRTGTLREGRFKSVMERRKLTQQGADGMSGSEWYRMMLFADGEEAFSSKPAQGIEKFSVRKGFNRKDVEAVLARGGKLTFGGGLNFQLTSG